jgi:hypothetical protein
MFYRSTTPVLTLVVVEDKLGDVVQLATSLGLNVQIKPIVKGNK